VSITPDHVASFLVMHAKTVPTIQCNLPVVDMLVGSLLCLGWYMGFKVEKEYLEVHEKRGETL
jgi:hypothetical protein